MSKNLLVINNITDKESLYNIVSQYLLVTTVYWLYLISCLYTNTFAQIYIIEEIDLISPISFPRKSRMIYAKNSHYGL